MTMKSDQKRRHKAELQTRAAQRARERAEFEAQWVLDHPDLDIALPDAVEPEIVPGPPPPPPEMRYRLTFDRIGHQRVAPMDFLVPLGVTNHAQYLAQQLSVIARSRLGQTEPGLQIVIDLEQMVGTLVGAENKIRGRFFVTVENA